MEANVVLLRGNVMLERGDFQMAVREVQNDGDDLQRYVARGRARRRRRMWVCALSRVKAGRLRCNFLVVISHHLIRRRRNVKERTNRN